MEIKQLKAGDTGEVQDVYIKKTNGYYSVVIRTPKGDFYDSSSLNSGNYSFAKLFFRFWKNDLMEYGRYYKVNATGGVLLSHTPYK